MNTPAYIVITPARNEELYLRHTIRSMVGQRIRPQLWIVVDDGSSDGTSEIVQVAMTEHPWIRMIRRQDRGFRQQGGGVVNAFDDGRRAMGPAAWEFLVKLDADLSFPADYFERCLQKFGQDLRLGIGGGMICQEKGGSLVCESPGDPAFHVRGATKIYRRACWEAIGGLCPAPGWDSIDELKANMLGWTTRTFCDLRLHHHRFTGTTDGTWRNFVKFGLSNYVAGYHPLFMLAKCLKRLLQRPWLLGAAGLAWGFSKGYLTCHAQVRDAKLIRYVRRQQLNKLLLKPSIW